MELVRILLVDDEPKLLESNRRMLQREYAVETAISAQEALGMLENKGPFAVVVSDIMMPEMDGITFLSIVKERFPGIIRVALTGHADLRIAVDAVNQGDVFRFLTKPCSHNDLKKAINAGIAQLEMEKEARESEIHRRNANSLQMVVHKSPTPMCIVNDNGQIEVVNQACTESFGYTLQEIDSVLDWLDIACRSKQCRRRLENYWFDMLDAGEGEGKSLVWKIKRKSGEERVVSFRLVKIGKQIVVTLTDLTDQFNLVNSLNRAKRNAEEASRLKDSFLTNMSHEVRTPLNGIIGMLQLMQDTDLDHEQEEYLQAAYKSSKRLAKLLSDIMDFVGIDTYKRPVHNQFVSINSIFDHIDELFQPVSIDRQINFVSHLDKNVPELLVGDQARIEQILVNLIGNSFKFSSSGTIHLTATGLSSSCPNAYRVLFSVSDSGIGIGDAAIGSIVDPFVQASVGINRSFEGAGLGLTICQRMVDLLGGTMAIESSKQQGTTVYVSIPFTLP